MECVFCDIAVLKSPAFIIYRDDMFLAFLDKYPQSPGHLQLIPKAHYRWIYDLPNMGNIFRVAQKIIRAIIPVTGADHVTMGTFGREIHHAHIWIVPQYRQNLTLKEGYKSNVNKHNLDEIARKLKKAIN